MRRALVASLLLACPAMADVTNWKVATADDVGAGGWSDTNRTAASDNNRASTTGFQNVLNISAFGFDDSGADGVPEDATITGVEVAVEGFGSSGTASDRHLNVAVVSNGDPSAYTTYAMPQSTDSTVTHGGSSDLWGLTIPAAHVRQSDFGIKLLPEAEESYGTISVDLVQVRIHYTPAASGRRRFF